MYKVDKLRKFFDCELCLKTLVDPVTIPCGSNVCKRHIDDVLEKITKDDNSKNDNFLQCVLCYKDHPITKEGFEINKRLRDGLEIEFNTLKLTPVFDECKVEIQKAKQKVAEIEKLEKNSENNIYEYFEDIKRQVDIRREDMKTKIDAYSNEIIHSIEDTQSNYIKLSKEVDTITTSIETSKRELDDYIKRFDTLEIDEKKFEGIKNEVVGLNQKFNQIINNHNKLLIGNKEYSFKFHEIPIADIFGCFIDIKRVKLFDSMILSTSSSQSDLNLLCQFPESQKWELKYRASRDGFSTENFHSKCDEIPNTLTIIKSTNGNVFGGFTEKGWSSNGGLVSDTQAFIISLINAENNPFKALFSNNGYALVCNPSYGPVFGNPNFGYDIFISSNSNTSQVCSSSFGYTYHHPDYQKGTQKAKSILAGSRSFQTVEIEVFTKKN